MIQRNLLTQQSFAKWEMSQTYFALSKKLENAIGIYQNYYFKVKTTRFLFFPRIATFTRPSVDNDFSPILSQNALWSSKSMKEVLMTKGTIQEKTLPNL